MKFIVVGLVVLMISTLVIASCTTPDSLTPPTNNADAPVPAPIASSAIDAVKTDAQGEKYLIDPSEFRSGGPGLGGIGTEGGIAALLDPDFIEGKDARYLIDDELVLGIVHKGEARAYPYRILIWHEIVNDVIQDAPIMVSYCPLCFTGVAFDSVIDGKRELFGVSGKLYNSELVMYDQSTESYWPQSLGKAVVGERTGTIMKKIPLDVVRWGDWLKAHPDTKVLSLDTGFSRSYGRNPYGSRNDYTDINFRLGVDNPDTRLPAQEIVYGVEVDGAFTAYPSSIFKNKKVINDEIGGKEILIEFDDELNSPVVQTKNADGEYERIAHEPIFWFAWSAFHPNTEIYE
jgi:hypothetical protein